MNQLAFASTSPVYQSAHTRKLRPSVIVGLAIAIGLHLALIVYLIGQTIASIPVPVETPDSPPIIGGIISLSKPDEPKPVINVHKPENPVETKTPPLPATPQDSPEKTVSGPVQPTLPSGGEAASSATSETTAGPVAVAKWSRFPGPEALSTYYPQRALDAEVEGVTTLECVVRDASGRVLCHVLSEQPGGYGFGEATRRMIEKVGRVEVNTGGMVVGSTLRLSVKWNLPQ